jgi:hypothetical protein
MPESFNPSFSTFVDGRKNEFVRDVGFDALGNIYITGGTEDITGFRLSPGNDYYAAAGKVDHGWFKPHDVFIQKYDPSGHLLWSSRIGGVNYDRAYAIEVDDHSGVYIAGRAGRDFYTTKGGLQEAFGGNQYGDIGPYGKQDSFVAKFDAATGKLNWSTYFGGASGEIIRDIDVGPDGSVHIAQTFVESGVGQHITSDAMQPFLAGKVDDVYAQLSNDGTKLLYGTFIGGESETITSGGNPAIIVDGNGDINMITMTDARHAPTTPGALRTAPVGETDIYVVKFDGADGGRSIKSATYFGTSDADLLETHNLAIDPVGNFIIAGRTLGKDLANTSGAFQTSLKGLGDGFVAIVSADGKHVLRATYFGGSGEETVEGVVYKNGSIYIAGGTSSADLPVTDKATGGYHGVRDAYVAKFSADLTTLEYATYLGGSGLDEARTMDVSPDGGIAIAGHTESANFLKVNASDNYIAGARGGFLTYLDLVNGGSSTPPGTTPPPLDSTPEPIPAPEPEPEPEPTPTPPDASNADLTIIASADNYNGGAKARVVVNGSVADTIEVTASHAQGDTQRFEVDLPDPLVNGDVVEVSFFNDLYKPDVGADRNLYIHEVKAGGDVLDLASAAITARYGGYASSEDTLKLSSNGAAVMTVTDASVVSQPGKMLGSEILLTASAELYQGPPQAKVFVNRKVVDVIEVTADHALGKAEVMKIAYDGIIDHDDVIKFQFFNDNWGEDGASRNLIIEELMIDGHKVDLSAVRIGNDAGYYEHGTGALVLESNGGATFYMAHQDIWS